MSIKGAKKYRLRDLPKGERLEYFWMYYKFHLIFGLLGAFLIGYTLYGVLKPRPDLQVMWMSDKYTTQCEYALRDTLESLDWDTNGDGKTRVLLTYVDFEQDYHQLSYSLKSEITVLVAGQEYSFFIVNDHAWDWMLENELPATWREIGVDNDNPDGFVLVPLSQLEAFSGDYMEPLEDLYLCAAQAVQGKEDEYALQAEALRRFLADQNILSSVS